MKQKATSMSVKNEGSASTVKQRVKRSKTRHDTYSEQDQEANEDDLLAYYNLAADQRKQSSWLNEGWEA